jgi:hypothetical protein
MLRLWLVLATCFLISGGYWYWALKLYAPANAARVLASGRPIGNHSDLYPRWLGSRELLLHGRDPYGSEVTRDIQIGFYGRPLDPQKPTDPVQRESFVYPLYTVFLLAPVIFMPFSGAVVVFRWLLLASIALSVPLWMRALGLRPRALVVLSAMLLSVSSPPALLEYFQQNLTALAVLFIAAAAAAVVRDWLIPAGIFLALATIKPDVTTAMILWFLLWAASRFKDRGSLILSFGITLMLLVVAAEFSLHGWIASFVTALREYPTYGTDPSILEVLLPLPLARLLTAILAFSALGLCWRWRRASPASSRFALALAWVGSVTLVVLPKLAAYNQILLLPALLLLAASYRKISTLGLLPRALTKAAFLCAAWLWTTAAALSLFTILRSPIRSDAVTRVPDYTSLALTPLTLTALIAVTFAIRDRGADPKSVEVLHWSSP